MLINTQNKTLNLKKSTLVENLGTWIEQDIIVPDSKPDALKIVNIIVTPYVNNYEVNKSSIKVMGKLNYFIIYKVSDDKFGTRGLYVTFPFNEVLECNKISKECNVIIEPKCKNVIYSLPNERKISVKSEINFKVKISKNVTVNLIKNFEESPCIETKCKEEVFDNIICQKESVIASKEEVMLPKEADDFFELLKAEPKIVNTEYKDSFNKIMLKGDIDIDLMYIAQDSDEEVKKVKLTVPFSAMVELENISERAKFDIKYVIEDFAISLNTEITSTKTFNIEYQIGSFVTMYEEEDIEYVQDFYSQNKELNYEEEVVEAMSKSYTTSKDIVIKESLNDVVPQDMKIIDYWIDTNNLNISANTKQVTLQGNAKLYLILQNIQNNELESKTVDIMIDQNYDVGVSEPDNVYASIEDKILSVTQRGNDIDVVLTLIIDTNVENISKISIIDKIEDAILNSESLDSINIYVVKKGDSLWNIAKKYKTSVDKIVKTNEIDNKDQINIGEKLLIIR